MSEFSQHDGGILRVKVPLPFPLRWVNSYLIRGSGRYTLVDPGIRTAESEAAWQSALEQCGIGYGDIDRIILTHHHPDHYGLAGWFQEQTSAPVYLSTQGLVQARLLWGPERTMSEEMTELFRQHGMDSGKCENIYEHMESFLDQVSPQPQVTLLNPGDKIRMGDREYETIHTPGHADGHLCLYNFEAKVMFCGDHVLPRISPNVSYIPGMDANPLQSYLDHLQRIAEYEVVQAYPGHREPFTAFRERALELVGHHEQRLQLMEEQLQQPMTCYQLCQALFGDRLSLHQLRFAMAETLAHVVYLDAEGRAERKEDNGVFVYRSI